MSTWTLIIVITGYGIAALTSVPGYSNRDSCMSVAKTLDDMREYQAFCVEVK